MGGPAKDGGLMDILLNELQSMASMAADAAIVKAGETSGAALFSTGRKGAAEVDAGPAKSQG